jgi:agmatinase
MKKFANWSFENLKKENSNVIFLGINLGKGSKKMLDCIREVSDFVDVMDVDRKKNMIENLEIFDSGDLELKNLNEITSETKKIIDEKKFPLILGKSHLLTLYTMKAFPKNTKIIHFDAHGDIKDSYFDELIEESIEPLKLDKATAKKYNCTTWLRRVCEINGTNNVAMIGLRDCDQDDFEYIEKNNILYFTPNQIRKSDVKEKLRKFVKNSNVYISLDIDVFDPAFAPAVDHPEPNGINFQKFLELVDEVCKGKIVGMDIVEIQPIPNNRITEFLAVESIFQVLSRVIKK